MSMRSRVLHHYPPINHYELLGLEHNASPTEIRTAYLELVRIYHPDNAPPAKKQASHVIFKTITEAYATLSKPDARKLYDHKLRRESLTHAHPSDITNDNSVTPLWRKIFKSKA